MFTPSKQLRFSHRAKDSRLRICTGGFHTAASSEQIGGMETAALSPICDPMNLGD
jgi:hypothetical protein